MPEGSISFEDLPERFHMRHPSTQHILKFLTPNPNLPEFQHSFATQCYNLALDMADLLPDGIELTVGLRKLLEAKDCFVRASVEVSATDE